MLLTEVKMATLAVILNILTHYLLVSSADNLWKQFGTQIWPDRMSGLIWIQTVWHSDRIPEIIFRKKWFGKNQQATKNIKNFPGGKELM